MITGKAKLAGVMGYPVSHSKSPKLHGYWLETYGIDGAYVPMAVEPTALKEALRALPVLGFQGVNLTIPHKEKAMSIVDDVDRLGQRIGAVNTIIVDENKKLRATNTDAFGFSENLLQAGFRLDPKKKIATVLGAGGASRAIIVALEDMGFTKIHLINRDQARAEKVVEELKKNAAYSVSGWNQTETALEESALVVNASSLGMDGQPPLEIDLSPMAKTAWVTDVVYAPLETNLLKQAREKGLNFVDGLGMLLYQACPGFEAWFGRKPEVTKELRQRVLV